MRKIMLLLALVAIAIAPFAAASPYDDCYSKYCQSGYVKCSDALCPEVVSGCAGPCLDIYTMNPSPCVGACELMRNDEACVKPYMDAQIASCLSACWNNAKPAVCGYWCLDELKKGEANCQGGMPIPKFAKAEEWRCSDGSSYSNTSFSSDYCYARAEYGFCCCNSGYKTNHQGAMCIRCGDRTCDYQNGENCETCEADCGCGDTGFCDIESTTSNVKGCDLAFPVISYVEGDVRAVKDGVETPITPGQFFTGGESIRLYPPKYPDYKDAFVEIRWPGGQIGKVLLSDISGDYDYEEFVLERSRGETLPFSDWTPEEQQIIDTLSFLKIPRAVIWVVSASKHIPAVIAAIPVLYIMWPNPAGKGATYIKSNSEFFIEPQANGSIVVGTIEGSPEIRQGNKNVTVLPGLYSVIGPDGAPSQPQPFDPSKLDRWWERYGGGGDNTLIIFLAVVIAIVGLVALFKLKRKRVGKI